MHILKCSGVVMTARPVRRSRLNDSCWSGSCISESEKDCSNDEALHSKDGHGGEVAHTYAAECQLWVVIAALMRSTTIRGSSTLR